MNSLSTSDIFGDDIINHEKNAEWKLTKHNWDNVAFKSILDN